MTHLGRFSIPQLCKNSSVLMVIVFTELFAIIFTLLIFQQEFWSGLGLVSLYLQWTLLSAIGLLCLFRNKLNNKPTWVTLSGALLCCMLPFLITEISSQYVFNRLSFAEFDISRLIRFSVVALIAIGIVLRLFAIFAVLDQRSKSEMTMRLQAVSYTHLTLPTTPYV